MGTTVVKADSNPVTSQQKVSLGEKIAYGMGNFGTQMVFNPATTFMVFFYTDIAGIAAATVGTMLFISRFFDVLNPVMGVIVDRTNSRWGKARPWLLFMAVPFGISAALLFTSPDLSPTAKVIYAFITYNLAFTFFYAPVDIPYSSMLPLITTEQHERTKLSVARMILSNVGIVLSFAITMPLVKYLGDGKQGWSRAFIIFGVIATACLLWSFAGTKERVKATVHAGHKVPLKDGLSSLFHNKYILLLGGLMMTLFLMLGLLVANLYYCRYFLHNADLFGPLMTMMTIAQISGMFFTPMIVKRLGKRTTAMAGLVVTIIGQLMLYITPLTFPLLAVATIIKGLGAAPLIGTAFAMMADAIEYGEWQRGFRIDGLAFGAMALAMKISIGIGNVLVGWILAWGGYVANSETQTASALESIKILFQHMPLLFFVMAFLFLLAYNLDKRFPEIAADLQKRRAGLQHG